MIGHDLVTMGIPILEKVIRTVAVYGGLAVLLRIGGKRDLAQLNTFDLVVMLLLSNVVQNAIIGEDNSLVGGLIGATVLIAVNAIIVRMATANGIAEAIFEGTPTQLVHDGDFDMKALQRLGLRRADLKTSLRMQGATDVKNVEEAVLEPGGSFVVTLRPENEPATRAQIDELRDAVNKLTEAVTKGR